MCRKTFPALRLTSYKMVLDLAKEYKIYPRLHHDKVSNTLTCPWTGSFMSFLSIDDPEKIKSSEWSDIWMEEASEFEWNDFLILQTRLSAPQHHLQQKVPNQFIMSLNPTEEEGWINQKIVLAPNFAGKVELIHSTYRDNPFLDDEYVGVLKGLKEQDANAFQIYAEGKYGRLTHVIYSPFTLVQQIPDAVDEIFYGLDFGFNNPTALVEIHLRDAKHFYLRQLLYHTGLTNADLIEHLKHLIPEENRHREIYADAAEPDRIEEISAAGFNIHSADKEVNRGIDYCKRQRFYTLASNVDINKERAAYKWKVDKNGKVLDEPVKFLDHTMDAVRYGCYTRWQSLKRQPQMSSVG